MFDYQLTDIIRENAEWYPESPALIEGDEVLSWEGLLERVAAMQMGLRKLGVGKGDRLAVVARNSIDQVALGYAAAGLGVMLLPINWRYTAKEMAFILGDASPVAVVTEAEFRSTVSDAIELVEAQPRVVIRDDKPQDDEVGWDEIVSTRGETVERSDSWEDAHLLLYTSGTTGNPKGAIISQRRTVLDGLSAISAFGVRPRECFLNYLPLFHTGAWDYIKQYFLVGGCVIIMREFDAGRALDLIRRHNPNALFGVPLVLGQILEHPDFESTDLSSVRLIAYGSYDPSDLMQRVRDAFVRQGATGLQLAHAYGLTEGGPFVTILRPEDSIGSLGSVGTPVPGVAVALLDDNGHRVATGERGEICVRSPALMDGYWNQPDATEAAFAHGWLHTGDIGQVGDGGLLFVVDRKKDMIRTGAENVFPKEVEGVLVEHPGVKDCAVVGAPDAEWGERVVAVIVPSGSPPPSEEEIRTFAREKLAGFKVPKEVRLVKSIPKTPAGKTAKHELRKEVGSVFGEDRDNTSTKGKEHA